MSPARVLKVLCVCTTLAVLVSATALNATEREAFLVLQYVFASGAEQTNSAPSAPGGTDLSGGGFFYVVTTPLYGRDGASATRDGSATTMPGISITLSPTDAYTFAFLVSFASFSGMDPTCPMRVTRGTLSRPVRMCLYGNNEFYIGIEGVSDATSSTTAATWHHVAVTVSETRVIGYMDGVAVLDQLHDAAGATTESFALGIIPSVYLRNVRVWSTEFANDTVQALLAYDMATAAPTSAPTAVPTTAVPTAAPTTAVPTAAPTTDPALVLQYDFETGAESVNSAPSPAADTGLNSAGYFGVVAGVVSGRNGTFLSGNASLGVVTASYIPAAAFTVALWFSTSNVGMNAIILRVVDGGWPLRTVYAPGDGTLRANVYNIDYNPGDAAATLVAGEWYHVVIVGGCSNATSIYVNGTLVHTSAAWCGSSDQKIAMFEGRVTTCCYALDTAQRPNGGYLQHVRLWNVARTPGEVADLYAADVAAVDATPSPSITPTDAPTVAPLGTQDAIIRYTFEATTANTATALAGAWFFTPGAPAAGGDFAIAPRLLYTTGYAAACYAKPECVVVAVPYTWALTEMTISAMVYASGTCPVFREPVNGLFTNIAATIAGRWAHFVQVQRIGYPVLAYANGVLVYMGSVNLTDISRPITVGPSDCYFQDVQVDEVLTYAYAMNATQVLALYTGVELVSESSLEVQYVFAPGAETVNSVTGTPVASGGSALYASTPVYGRAGWSVTSTGSVSYLLPVSLGLASDAYSFAFFVSFAPFSGMVESRCLMIVTRGALVRNVRVCLQNTDEFFMGVEGVADVVSPLSAETWHHIAVTASETRVVGYLNGAVLLNQSHVVTAGPATETFIIGLLPGVYQRNVRIWSEALSYAAVQALYVADLYAALHPLVAQYDFLPGAVTANSAPGAQGATGLGSAGYIGTVTGTLLGRTGSFLAGNLSLGVAQRTVPSLGDVNAYTVAFWFAIVNTSASIDILEVQNSVGPVPAFYTTGDGTLHVGYQRGFVVGNTTSLTAGVWHHCVITASRVNYSFAMAQYVNGVEVWATTDYNIGQSHRIVMFTPLWGAPLPAAPGSDGYLQSVRMWANYSTADEVAALYASDASVYAPGAPTGAPTQAPTGAPSLAPTVTPGSPTAAPTTAAVQVPDAWAVWVPPTGAGAMCTRVSAPALCVWPNVASSGNVSAGTRNLTAQSTATFGRVTANWSGTGVPVVQLTGQTAYTFAPPVTTGTSGAPLAGAWTAVLVVRVAAFTGTGAPGDGNAFNILMGDNEGGGSVADLLVSARAYGAFDGLRFTTAAANSLRALQGPTLDAPAPDVLAPGVWLTLYITYSPAAGGAVYANGALRGAAALAINPIGGAEGRPLVLFNYGGGDRAVGPVGYAARVEWYADVALSGAQVAAHYAALRAGAMGVALALPPPPGDTATPTVAPTAAPTTRAPTQPGATPAPTASRTPTAAHTTAAPTSAPTQSVEWHRWSAPAAFAGAAANTPAASWAQAASDGASVARSLAAVHADADTTAPSAGDVELVAVEGVALDADLPRVVRLSGRTAYAMSPPLSTVGAREYTVALLLRTSETGATDAVACRVLGASASAPAVRAAVVNGTAPRCAIGWLYRIGTNDTSDTSTTPPTGTATWAADLQSVVGSDAGGHLLRGVFADDGARWTVLHIAEGATTRWYADGYLLWDWGPRLGADGLGGHAPVFFNTIETQLSLAPADAHPDTGAPRYVFTGGLPGGFAVAEVTWWSRALADWDIVADYTRIRGAYAWAALPQTPDRVAPPTRAPTRTPTRAPTVSQAPTAHPSAHPTTATPTHGPTVAPPSAAPTRFPAEQRVIVSAAKEPQTVRFERAASLASGSADAGVLTVRVVRGGAALNLTAWITPEGCVACPATAVLPVVVAFDVVVGTAEAPGALDAGTMLAFRHASALPYTTAGRALYTRLPGDAGAWTPASTPCYDVTDAATATRLRADAGEFAVCHLTSFAVWDLAGDTRVCNPGFHGCDCAGTSAWQTDAQFSVPLLLLLLGVAAPALAFLVWRSTPPMPEAVEAWVRRTGRYGACCIVGTNSRGAVARQALRAAAGGGGGGGGGRVLRSGTVTGAPVRSSSSSSSADASELVVSRLARDAFQAPPLSRPAALALAAIGAAQLLVAIVCEVARPSTADGRHDPDRVGGDSQSAHDAAVFSVAALASAASFAGAWIAWRMSAIEGAQAAAATMDGAARLSPRYRVAFQSACVASGILSVALAAVLLWPAPVAAFLAAGVGILVSLGMSPHPRRWIQGDTVSERAAPPVPDVLRALALGVAVALYLLCALAFLARPCGDRWQPVPASV